jgi:SAM-dependent methyltransferase
MHDQHAGRPRPSAHEHRTAQHETTEHHEPTEQPWQEPAEFWEEFYGDGQRRWSGRPNRILVEELSRRRLTPGSVLDLGSGTGADAVWFAELGWTVTGVDISAAALAVAAEAAQQAGVGDRVTWLRRDLETAFPTGTWDLVVASYLHSPVAFERHRVLRQAADAVTSGGTLLILGHEGFPAWHQSPVTMPSIEDVLTALDLADWETVRTESVGFAMTSPDGEPGERTDHVIRLRRT